MKTLLPISLLRSFCIHVLGAIAVITVGTATSWAIVVTSLADSGAGTLREAISIANGDGGTTSITFDPLIFPPRPAAPGVITITSGVLPNMTGVGDSIDGTGSGVVISSGLAADGLNTGIRVRASNVTIRGIAISNFLDPDAVRVEGRNATPTVTGVTIIDNMFSNNGRGVRVDGGSQLVSTFVSATVSGNFLDQNVSGIAVRGNTAGSDGGNTVHALIDSNVINGKKILPSQGGDGIQVIGGIEIGSNNEVRAAISNNTLREIADEGIAVNGCGANATGSNNTLDVVVQDNTIKYSDSDSPANFLDHGIIVNGAAGESDLLSFCTGNTVLFELSGNKVDGFKYSNITVNGGDEGTQGNSVHGTISDNKVSDGLGRGINATGGSGSGNSVSVCISDNQSSGNTTDGIRVSDGLGSGNTVTIECIINNAVSRNGGDGITIGGNVPGMGGGTAISGNRSDRNAGAGINILSTGYVLSNNRASRNSGAGISAIDNTNAGGNVATGNTTCNTPGCF